MDLKKEKIGEWI